MLNILIFNLIGQMLGGILYYLFFRMVLVRRVSFLKLFSVYMLFYIPYAIFGGWIYLSGIIYQYEFALNLFLEVLSYFMLVLIFHILTDINWRKSTVFAFILQFITSSTLYISSMVQTGRYDLTNFFEFIRYTFETLMVSPLLAVLVFWLLKRIRFSVLLNTLLKNEKKLTVFALISLILPVLYTAITFLSNTEDYFTRGIYSLFLILAFLGFIRYLVMNESNLARLQAKEALLLQQQSYTEHLEKMQEDMRLFRHDYKNMLSSMYLYAKEGQNEPIQEFIHKTLDTIDESVTEEIRQTTHLAKIQIIELKSLLLTKLMSIRKKGITCTLEVSEPLAFLPIETDALCRCIGILLDNAIEAVENEEVTSIDILINNTSSQTTFVIQNPTSDIRDFHCIGTCGYSTKGTGRGLGLYSYHKILSLYENAFSSTYVKNNCFVQELTIQKG